MNSKASDNALVIANSSISFPHTSYHELFFCNSKMLRFFEKSKTFQRKQCVDSKYRLPLHHRVKTGLAIPKYPSCIYTFFHVDLG